MKHFLTILAFIVLSAGLLYAAWIDTGMIEWQQPNGTTFMAKWAGDEFYSQFTTDNGYEVRQGVDGWYYYAVLDENDNIVPSDKKVGIDTPTAESYNLQLPANKLQEIEDRRAQFREELQIAAERYRQKREAANGNPVALNLGIILVDFADSVHWKTTQPPYPFPDGYQTHYFEDMIFSNNGAWFDTLLTFPPVTHPENQKVFGSVREYYKQQSLGMLDIPGEVLNPEDPQHPGIPQWVYLDQEKSYWSSQPLSMIGAWWGEAKSKLLAIAPGINFDAYDHLVFLYAGDLASGALHPAARPLIGAYQMGERFLSAFSHIGVHCHEFAHLLGAYDEYEGVVNPNFWEVMAHGDRNGPNYASCPSDFSPYYRIFWEWADVTYLTAPNPTLTLNYNYGNPEYYRIDNLIDPTEYFILENRLREGFDLWTPNDPVYDPNDPNDPNDNDGGLLIWSIDQDNVNDDKVYYKPARAYLQNQTGDPFPYIVGDPPGSGQNLTPATTPNNSLRTVTNPGIEITNITWDPLAKTTTINVTNNYDPNSMVLWQNTIWSSSQVISQNVYVMGDATLTIQPGVTIQFQTGKKLVLMGGSHLVAQGTVSQPIVLESANSPQKWAGLVIADRNVDFTHSNLTIREATNGISLVFRFNVEIESIYFKDNQNAINVPNQEGSALIEVSNCELINSPISYLNTNNGQVDFIFLNCFFENSSLSLTNPTSMNFFNNTLVSNSTINKPGSGSLTAENNIFYKFSSNNFINASSGNLSIRYNCLHSTNPSPDFSLFSQAGNFSADPKFVNPQGPQPDYHLLETSPCIDAGDPLADYSREPGNNGGRVNIGHYGNTPEATQTNPFNPPAWENEIIFLGDFLGTGNIRAVPGLTAKSATDKQIKIKGILNAYGNQSSGITFTNYNAGGQWKGLYADAGSQINLDYCIIENSTKGLFNDFQNEPAILPNLSTSHSTIQNNEMGNELFYSHLNFQDNTYHNNSRAAFYANLCRGTLSGNHLESNGKGLDLNRCLLTISGNIISNNDAAAIFLSWDQGSTLNNNIIENNGYVPTDLPWSERSGITLYRSSPLLWENTIQNNRGNGLLAFASSIPVLNAKDELNLNLVKNNGTDPAQGQFPYESSELYFHDYAQPQMANGHNDIIDESNINEDNFLFYLEPEDGAEVSINISGNYWGMDESNFDYDRFYPLDILIIDPYDEEPNVQGGFAKTGSKPGAGGVNRHSFGKTGAISLLDSLFHHAVVLEDSGFFGEAYNRFFSILQNYPDSAVSYSSMPRLIRCGLKSGISIQDLKNTLHDLQSASSYPYILKQTPAFINECEIVDEEFFVVINNLNQLLADSIPTIDSLYAELDLSSVQLLDGQTGSSKASGLNGITGIAAFSSFRNHILEQVLNRASASEAIAEIPATFALSQNYPNPFNPTTTIRYQLPKPAWVRLEIYNILGQKIKTLIDARQSADFYAVPWDGTNHAGSQVASGMYVYRLAAELEKKEEKIVMVKKMLLIR